MHTTATQPISEDRQRELQAAFSVACRACRERVSGLHLSTFFLPAAKRDAACAAMAFCQMIEDAIAEPENEFEKAANRKPGVSLDQLTPESTATATHGHGHDHHHDHGDDNDCSGDTLDARVEMLSRRLDEIYAGAPELPTMEFRTQDQHVMLAASAIVHEYQIEKGLFLALANERRRHVSRKRYRDWPELLHHCEQTGGVKAQILVCVLGLSHSDAKADVVALGAAIRLVEILNDLSIDLPRGRVYLPQDELVGSGYSRRELVQGVPTDAWMALLMMQVARARVMLLEATEVVAWLGGDGPRMMASVIIIGAMRLLRSIEAAWADVLRRRIRLSLPARLAVLPRAWKLARRLPDQPMPRIM